MGLGWVSEVDTDKERNYAISSVKEGTAYDTLVVWARVLKLQQSIDQRHRDVHAVSQRVSDSAARKGRRDENLEVPLPTPSR